jgi:CHAT domain-containing protein/tetratricopeptide (TPR) repeat protein
MIIHQILRQAKKIVLFTFLLFLVQIPNAFAVLNETHFSPSEQFLSLSKEAEKCRSEGDYEKAIGLLKKSLEYAKKIADGEKECDTLLNLGLMYWNIGKLDVSSDYYSKAFSLAKTLNLEGKKNDCQTALDIYSYYEKGKKFRSSGQYQESIENYQKAIKLAKELGSKEHEVKCLRQLSVTFWELPNLKEFYSLNIKALEIARLIRHRKEEGRCLKNIGIYYWQLDSYSKAINYFDKALAVAEYLSNEIMSSDYLNLIGITYRKIGNYDKALDYLLRAFKKAQKVGDSYLFSAILNNIGNIYRDKGILSGNEEDLYQALNYHEKSLEISQKSNDLITEIEVLNNLGSVHSDLKNFQKALDYFQQGYEKAEKINDIEAKGMILNNIGIVHFNQGNYEESTRYYQKAIDLAQELEGGQILWEAYFEIANAYAKQNKIFEALKNYKNSIRIIENIRSQIKLEELKASYLGTDKRIEAYQNLIHLLISFHKENKGMGYDRQAFEYLERAKARSFLDSLEVAQVDISMGINFKLKNQEKELMKDISSIYNKLLVAQFASEEKENLLKQLTEKENNLEALKREIRSKSPYYADLKYPEIITLEETQKKLLNNKSAFIVYTIGKEHSYGFVITNNELMIFPVPKKSIIQNLVSEYLLVITDRDSKEFDLGYDLCKVLVPPNLDENIEKIIFIPDDILHFLPFETLATHEKEPHWLVEDYKIAYAPSISSYREIIERRKKIKSSRRYDILAFGDPDFGQLESETNGDDIFQNFYSSTAFNFYRLKYSGIEIERISNLFKESKEAIFTRKAATEEQLKNLNLDDYKIIHFATHSLIDDKKPARSSIVLSLNSNREEDGFIQMREIYNLNLNSDLVTLSACQTGLGQFIKGEGIEGLNRSFFFAGASSVLMSLWAVNDQATYQLMERFYSHLRSSAPIANSLRNAKLEMIASEAVSHPYYWAGFIVSGNASQVIFPNILRRWLLIGGSSLFVIGLLFIVVKRNGFLARHP